MSRVHTWLIGQKKLEKYFRAICQRIPGRYSSSLLLPPLTTQNYSSYLSSYLNRCCQKDTNPSSPKVPPPGGTFSFRRASIESNSQRDKILVISEIRKIPSYQRANLVKLIERHRSQVFLCSIFNPLNFNYNLAEKNDFYFIKKRNWLPIFKQLNGVYKQMSARAGDLPEFPRRFTLKEKLVMRILWRFRRRFLTLEDISSYLYGRRMTHNLHSSEEVVWRVRRKLQRITGRSKVISNNRNFGYRVRDEVWNEINKDKSKIT